MQLSSEELAMLQGQNGRAVQKAMQILNALGVIYGAERMIPVVSVQISGVSYDNLGEAGLEFLDEMARGGGKARVLTTLNPAGMDIENWQTLGISEDFALNQQRVIQAFADMGVITTCSCTPYLFGNTPLFGEHIAWSESSAVAFANAVLGARTNREGGPSALAAALTGFTPEYGLHLDKNRQPSVHIHVEARLSESHHWGALGQAIGRRFETLKRKPIPYLTGVSSASLENLKSFCASVATYAGLAHFHIQGLTPEAAQYPPPAESFTITQTEIDETLASLSSAPADAPADFVSLGCPHLSLREIARIAELLKGKKVTREFWITTSRPVRQMADRMGYSAIIEASGAKFATDTCCVVAPIQRRFKVMATDSAKACYYAGAKNKFATRILPFDEVVLEATR
ncbi:MAG TPA: aconitase X catalytic domain-containing protein [Anaerolineaceae bacterium]|nr:aconitase X catalytic domain-containing protein [Anaerolineaceae bacterium]HPN51123.1 aconitase X catalytic domain-containing protein [Anaerolineaceae bacterium]